MKPRPDVYAFKAVLMKPGEMTGTSRFKFNKTVQIEAGSEILVQVFKKCATIKWLETGRVLRVYGKWEKVIEDHSKCDMSCRWESHAWNREGQ